MKILGTMIVEAEDLFCKALYLLKCVICLEQNSSFGSMADHKVGFYSGQSLQYFEQTDAVYRTTRPGYTDDQALVHH